MKFAIAAIVKDEIDSLEEWIAYHRVLGADHFLLADNGSSDGTREYLLSLSDLPWLTFMEVVTPPDQAPQLIAYHKLTAECPASIDLIAYIDADEYILPMPAEEEMHLPLQQQMDHWMNACFTDDQISAVVLNWACFGSSGHKFKKEGLVIERFQKRSKQNHGPNHHYKVIVRHKMLERMENPHQPVLKSGAMVNALGQAFDYFVSRTKGVRKGLSKEVIWQGARLNHYIVKSVEEFVLKKSKRGSASMPGRTKKADYFEQHDKNDVSDTLLAHHVEAIKNEIIELNVHSQINKYLGDIDDTRHLGHRIEKVLFRRKKESVPSLVREFVLDSPVEKQPATIKNGQVLVNGWLLLIPEVEQFHGQARIVLSWAKEFELKVPLDVKRPDVLEHFGLDASEQAPQLCSGFRAYLPLDVRKCALALELGEMRWPLREFIIEPPGELPDKKTMVYQGQDDFLFLQADSNQGLYQHRGQLLLTEKGLEAWQHYLDKVHQGANQLNANYRLLIAPAKEAVLEESFGEMRAALTPVEQVVHLSSHVLYPVAALKALGENAFYRTDTHWTHRAAMTALLDFLPAVGIDNTEAKALFDQDQYRKINNKGDLGGKLQPPMMQPVEVLASFNNNKVRRYDNHLPNFGRVVVFENEQSLLPSTLLIFGASSSTAMFNYAPRVFARVVYAHTTGYWDEAFAAQVQPDVVMLQTNGRFTIRPPLLTFSVQDTIRQKVREMQDSPEEIMQKRLIGKSMYPGTPIWQQWDEWLIDGLGMLDTHSHTDG